MSNVFPREIAEGLFVLGNRHFFTFLVIGNEHHALVETGVSATAPLVAGQLAELGIDREKIRYLVIPHAHFDHLGGLPYYRGLFPRAQVVCSSKAREVMTKPRVLEHFFREDAATSSLLEKWKVGRQVLSWLPGSVLEPGRTAGEGDLIVLGPGNTMKFIDAPGHSPCSLAVHLPERDALLVSDSLGFYLGPGNNFPIFFYNYHSYLDTIWRLYRLGASTVAAAHEYIFSGKDAVDCFTVAAEAAGMFRGFVESFRGSEEEAVKKLYDHFYRGGLTVYSPRNIESCIELLVRRVLRDTK